MKLLRIIVEGERDCYFLHNLIVQRLSGVLAPQYANGSGLEYGPTDVFIYLATASSDVKVQIVKTGGYAQLGTIKKALLDDGDDVLYRADIVFDADTTGIDNGGVTARTQVLMNSVSTLTAGLSGAKYGNNYFLVPDNVQDGDVETLMTAMAYGRFPAFFDPCWAGFQSSLNANQFAQLSDKSKIYDYIESAASRCTNPIPIKDKQGYNKNLAQLQLWDWSVHDLDRLVEFLVQEVGFVVSQP